MKMARNWPPDRDAPDAELIDSLIAVSVIAKRLAVKLSKQAEKERPSMAHRYGAGIGRPEKRRIFI